MTGASRCELSIIVPMLNEADTIGDLLHNLSWQRQVTFELILVDGGSSDGTLDLVRDLVTMLTYPVRIVSSERGRGRQLNAGAAAAHGEYLLFLHADSQFTAQDALRNGLNALGTAGAGADSRCCAAHYSLSFRRRRRDSSLFYYILECKARLDRPGCTHGDQGFLVSRQVFEQAGPFDETIPVLEDTRFAERIRAAGQWLLLPDELATSARRFEDEGEMVRQSVNAVIMALGAVGRDDFLRALPGIYAAGGAAGHQGLAACLGGIHGLLGALPWRERVGFWLNIGRFLSRNCWQLAFHRDARRNFRQNLPPGAGPYPVLSRYDRYGAWVVDSLPGAVCAAGMIRVIFTLMRVRARRGGRWVTRHSGSL